ncbi:hypothetical protein BH11BAC4_BH11BAC4_20200 [soil metagenome]
MERFFLLRFNSKCKKIRQAEYKWLSYCVWLRCRISGKRNQLSKNITLIIHFQSSNYEIYFDNNAVHANVSTVLPQPPNNAVFTVGNGDGFGRSAFTQAGNNIFNEVTEMDRHRPSTCNPVTQYLTAITETGGAVQITCKLVIIFSQTALEMDGPVLTCQ